MKYDIATKVLMEAAVDRVMEHFLGLQLESLEFVKELPQESVSLKRSDYVLKAMNKEGRVFIIILEFLSSWKKKSLLNLIDYTVRAMLKFDLPVLPAIILLKPYKGASDCYEDENLRFTFRLIKLYEFSASAFMTEADVRILPFVPLMEGGQEEEIAFEAERRIYESRLELDKKANLLTVMAIFAGLRDRELTIKLIRRRRDLMIESYAYEIIKEEGFEEGIIKGKLEGIIEGKLEGIIEGKLEEAQKALTDVIEARFDFVPIDIVKTVKEITDLTLLEGLHRKSVRVENLDEFREILKKALKLAKRS